MYLISLFHLFLNSSLEFNGFSANLNSVFDGIYYELKTSHDGRLKNPGSVYNF